RFMFQGREWIPELGIYDYRHRFYHPSLGRFLQADPTGFDAGDMNLFRYCGDNPVDRSDPTGLVDRDVNASIWNRLRIFDTSSSSQESLSDLNEALNRSSTGSDLTMAYRNDSSQGQQAGGPTTYPNSLAAARSRVDDVGKTVKSDKSTEAVSEIGQAENGSERYVMSTIHRGNGVGQVQNSQFNGKAQNSNITARYLPNGYRHVVGFVLGHPYYDSQFVRRDINIAKEN